MRKLDPYKWSRRLVSNGLPWQKQLRVLLMCAGILCLFLAQTSLAVQRFPRPDFESGYQVPSTTTPAARAPFWEYVDVAVLFLALAVATYLVLKVRSRRAVFWLMIFAIIYFGFWRRGCVCAVGSPQNMALAFFDSSYAVPLSVVAFFALPLLTALFFGRTFCAAVCPLGAVQDAVVWKPQKIPLWVNHVLSVVPIVYLGFAILFVATGTGFLICRWDPFIGFFRMNAPFHMLLFGGVILIVGMFIARPYCRFLCPYGVLLAWMSRFSRRHATITPDECIQCRLCEDACPFDAIRKPLPERSPESRHRGTRRIAVLLIALPLIMAGAAGGGYLIGPWFGNAHKTVRLAARIKAENQGVYETTTVESRTFRGSGETLASLYGKADDIRSQFAVGTAVICAFVALALWSRIFGLSLWRRRDDYEPDRGSCLSCGRCFSYCPREHIRRDSNQSVK